MRTLHRKMFALALSVAAVALAPAALAQKTDAPLPDADTLLAAYNKTLGGVEAMRALGNQGSSRFSLEFVEMGMTTELSVYSREGEFATKMTFPGVGDFRQGVTGEHAWSSDPANGPRLLRGEERQQLLEQMDPAFSTRDRSLIASAKTIGLAKSEGRACYEVEIVWKSGTEATDCYGVEDGMLLSTRTFNHSPMGKARVQLHYMEYKKIGPTMMATVVKVRAGGQSQVMRLQYIDTKAPAAEAFELPPAVASLIRKAGESSAPKPEAKATGN
jgi:hypothetical protein